MSVDDPKHGKTGSTDNALFNGQRTICPALTLSFRKLQQPMKNPSHVLYVYERKKCFAVLFAILCMRKDEHTPYGSMRRFLWNGKQGNLCKHTFTRPTFKPYSHSQAIQLTQGGFRNERIAKNKTVFRMWYVFI